jgi:spore coat protein CotH
MGGMGGAQPPPGGGLRPPPAGQAPAAGGQAPAAGGQVLPAGGQQPRAGGPGGRTNILVQRFQANPTFAGLYNQAKTDLKAQLFTSGKAAEVLDRWSGVLTTHAGDMVDAATVQREAANIAKLFG